MTHSSLTVPALLKGANIIELPDTATHRFRFDIPSESSNNLYRISQRITNGSTHGQYECSCKSWIYRRGGDGTGLPKQKKTKILYFFIENISIVLDLTAGFLRVCEQKKPPFSGGIYV